MSIKLIKATLLLVQILETALLLVSILDGSCRGCTILLSGNVLSMSILMLAVRRISDVVIQVERRSEEDE